MSLIGTKLTAKKGGAVYTIVGEDHDGTVVIAPEVHGPPERATLADLTSRFGVDAEPSAPVDEIASWKQLGDAFTAKVERANRREFAPRPASPEETFTRISDADAARLGHRR